MANNENVSWFFEASSLRQDSVYEPELSSFAPNMTEGSDGKSFNEHFDELCQQYKQTAGVDIKNDFRGMIGDRGFMQQYKSDLMKPVLEAFTAMSPNDPHIQHVIREVGKFWDNKVRTYTESASMMGFLPIATLEFPVLVKQFFSSILKDIIEVESVKSPNITKHIRTTYMVDNQTGDEYEYPKCMFDGTWEKIFDASKGHKIRETVVPFTNGRL